MGQVKRNRGAVAAAERAERAGGRAAAVVQGIRGGVPRELGAVLRGWNVPPGYCFPVGRWEVVRIGADPAPVVRLACRCGEWHPAAPGVAGFIGAVAAVAMHRAGLRPGLVPVPGRPVAGLGVPRAGGLVS